MAAVGRARRQGHPGQNHRRADLNRYSLFTAGHRPFGWLLALLLAVAFPGILAGTESFAYRDYGTFTYPLAYYQRECFWRGEWPLWNPWNHCGLPFLAQWNTLTLYPPSLFYLILPLPWSLGVFALAHLWLGGLGMAKLAERWGANRLGAAVAGLTYALNGLTLASLMWTSVPASLGWLPWVVLFTERAWRDGGRTLAPAAGVGALQMLSGTPEVIFLTWSLLVVLAAADGWRREAPRGLLWWRLVVVGGAVAGLSAVQLLPFFELVAHSHRDAQFAAGQEATASWWTMPWWGWANLVVPLFRCQLTPLGTYVHSVESWVASFYVGTATLALAAVCVLYVRPPRAWLLAGVALGTWLLALGPQAHFYTWLRTAFPPLGLMQYPVKFISLAIFCLPLLAGLAAASWTRADAPCADAVARGWRWVGLATSVLIVGVCGVAWRSPVMGEDRLVTLRSGLQSALAVVLVLAGLAALRRLAQDRLRPWVSLGLLLVLAVDALTHMPNLAPTVSARVLEPRVVQLTPRARLGEARALPRAEAVRRAQANLPSDLFRHLGLQRLALMYSANLLEGIPVVTGFFPLYLGPAAEVVAIASESCPAGLADFLGIAQVTQPGALTSWQHRPTALPWVTAGQEPVFAGPVATLRALKQESFDPRRQVFLPTELGSQVQAKRAAQARVTCDQFAAHDVALRVETDAPTWVVIAQAFYPAWHAWVDGQPAPLHQANYAFQAVEVPAGSHQVQLRYQDRAFRAGAVLSGLTLLTLWVMMKRYGPGDGDSAEPSGRL